MAANCPLVLTVDAQIDPLTRALAAGQNSLAQFGQSAAQAVQQTANALAQLNASPATAAKQMETTFAATVRNMQMAAQQAIKLGTDYNPLGGMNSASSAAAAQKLEELAQAEKNRAAAAAAAIPIDAQQEAILKVLATASTAAAAAFEQQAASMKDQAAALALVEAEMVAAGTATGNQANNQNQLHQSTQQLNLGQMELAHVARSVADSYAAGIPVSRIAAMEIGRISEAMMFYAAQSQNATGIMAKFAGVMGGPWGIALTLGIPIVTTIVGHIMEMNNEVSDATKKLTDQAHATDVARIAQQAFDQTLAGSIETEKKLTDELEKQLRTRREANMVKVGEAQTGLNDARQAQSDAEQRVRDAHTAVAKAEDGRTSTLPGPGGFTDPLGEAIYQGSLKALAKANADLAEARENTARAEKNLRGSQVVYEQDRNNSLSQKDGGHRDALEAQRSRNADDYRNGKITYDQWNLNDAKLSDALAKLGDAVTKGPSSAEQASIGDMIALLKQILPGVRITSTTGGQHVKGSDHYAGRAIDFVPAGGMGSIDFNEMKKLLEDAGVHIRRNASGTQQFFGPGHGPGGPDDHSHDNHYHVAWEGKASPEAADRIEQQRQAKAQESAKAYQSESDKLDQQILQYKAKHIDSLQDQLKALDDEADAEKKQEDDAIDAEAKQRGWTQAQTELLKLKVDQVATEKKAANQRDYDEKTAQARADQEKFLADTGSKILNLQLDMATTLDERRKIAKQLLDNERQEALAKINSDPKLSDRDKMARGAAVSLEYDQRGKQLTKQYADPMEQYKTKLQNDTQDMNTALKSVEADGLQSLSDGLLGIINGTETVAGAFKKMATSIISDLARIAIEKAILGVIGLASGGKVGDDDDFDYIGLADGGMNGMVGGIGGSRQDNVLTALSPGEFVINASSTARHRRLIEAINDNDPRIPHLAAGGMIATAYPSIPSAASLSPRGAANNNQPIYYDLRGAVMTEDLVQQMNQIAARHSAAVLLAAPQITQSNMTASARRNIPL